MAGGVAWETEKDISGGRMRPQPQDAEPSFPQARDQQAAQRFAADGDPNATTRVGPASTLATPPPAASERYALRDEIARGGMGVIFRATDTTLRRELAVKVLQDRFAPDSGVAHRFADEARIAAQLQHPGIPPVHDLGTLPDGRPFLAMKLIKGQTLEKLLHARTDVSSDRGRFVAIFEQVCQAIACAHAHNVIHRDLKPENVMVGAFGEVQVMDWGLAKVLIDRPAAAADAQETTLETRVVSLRDSDGSFTQAGSVLGTPAYMPPEQALGAVGKVDRRSDVFGLGGVLAAILTGRAPFAAGSAETVRLLSAQGNLKECFARLDGCGADPELVALCRRCLAPSPADRPADAGEVARAAAALRAAADERARRAELEKVRVEGEQATAAAQALERRKRRRLALAAAGLLVLAALGGLGTVLAVQRRANTELATKNDDLEQERQRALAAAAAEKSAKETAQARESETRAVLSFVEDKVFAAARPERLPGGLGPQVTLRRAVEKALPFLGQGFHEQPLVEARLRMTLGTSFWYLGEPRIAAEQFRAARAIYAERSGPDHPDTLKSMNNLANSYADLGRLAEALKLREETLALQKAKLGPDHPETLRNMNNLAVSYIELGRHAEALQLHEETLALRKAKLGPDHPDTLVSMHNLANSYADLGRQAEALKLREETLALLKAKLGPDHPDTLKGMNNLANSYSALGRQAEALKLYEETLALRKAKLGPDHPETLRSMLAMACIHALMIPQAADRGKQADLAMDWLKKAVAAGFNDVALMMDTDLDALRGRDDFKRLLADLEAKLAAEKK
jgi:tetratricopeptide (TPR) repeat protein/tRNA A-37 threonylcarbamoyl transferase component Bud32